jgi:hypothetical protein
MHLLFGRECVSPLCRRCPAGILESGLRCITNVHEWLAYKAEGHPLSWASRPVQRHLAGQKSAFAPLPLHVCATPSPAGAIAAQPEAAAARAAAH